MWLIQKHYKNRNLKKTMPRLLHSDNPLFFADKNLIRFSNINVKGQTDGLSGSKHTLSRIACSPGRANKCQKKSGDFRLLRSQLTISSDTARARLVSKLNLGSLGYTKTVAAEAEGVNAAEYRTEGHRDPW
jgi:hypothetical protein